MIDYTEFFAYLRTTVLADVAEEFAARTDAVLKELSHGDYDKWCAAIEGMPEMAACGIDLAADAVGVGNLSDMDDAQRAVLKEHLMELRPWRKGPFDLFGIHIDTEWRSDLKWARLNVKPAASGGIASRGAKAMGASKPVCHYPRLPAELVRHATHQVAPRNDAIGALDLRDKLVLDVGCGNGYYLFRMLGAGAKAVVGVDPFLLSVMQFHAVNRYAKTNRASVLPLGVDDVPENCGCFDTVFSMGLLYHRRQPKGHLAQLHGFLKPGGQVVLETLVLDTDEEKRLVPDGRYAKMRNVWAIASPRLLEKWLTESGFENVEILDITKTTSTEQRKTDWMTFESLDDFLDPNDNTKTLEGHPAPVRAIFVAKRK